MVNLGRKLHYLFPSANITKSWLVQDDGTGEFIAYFDGALGTQPDEPTLQAITVQMLVDFELAEFISASKAEALSSMDRGGTSNADRTERIVRAFALVVLDQFNAQGAKVNAILDAIDAASSLATLKTAVAAINNLPDTVTAQQMVDAIKAKIAA